MSVLRDEMEPCKVRLPGRRRWLRGYYRDNGDGTAFVIVGTERVTIGTKTYSGKMHNVPIDCVRPKEKK